MCGDDVTSDEDSGSEDLERGTPTPTRAASGATAASGIDAALHVAHSPAGFMGAGGRSSQADSVDVTHAPGTPLPSLLKQRQNPGSRLWRSEIEVR